MHARPTQRLLIRGMQEGVEMYAGRNNKIMCKHSLSLVSNAILTCPNTASICLRAASSVPGQRKKMAVQPIGCQHESSYGSQTYECWWRWVGRRIWLGDGGGWAESLERRFSDEEGRPVKKPGLESSAHATGLQKRAVSDLTCRREISWGNCMRRWLLHDPVPKSN